MHTPTALSFSSTGSPAFRLAGPLLVAGASVLWGTAGVASRYAPGVSAALLGEVRMLIGGLVLLAVFGPAGALRVLPALPRATLVTTGISMALFQWSFFMAVAHAGAGVAALVSSACAPFAAELIAALLARRMPPLRFWVALAGALPGVLWLARGADLSLMGVGFSLLAGTAYASYASAAARLQQAPGARNAGVPATAIALLCAGLLLLPAAGHDVHALFDGRALLVCAWLGLAGTALAYALFVKGLRQLTPGSALALVQIQPLAALAFGALLLGERFDVNTLVAMAFLAACALLCSFKPAAR
jgi:DME family drug/metabolite transporter